MISILYLITGVIAGYFAQSWYLQNFGWKHPHSQLYGILIFILVMYGVQVVLGSI